MARRSLLCCVVALACASFARHAAAVGQLGTQDQALTAAARMQWIDLREDNAAASPHRRLWTDKLDIAQGRWRAAGRDGALPAYALAHVIQSPDRSVVVSVLFDMFDCELPGNGAGADLYARCPMRVVHGTSESAKVITMARVCHLHMPDAVSRGEGPDPAKNMTTVRLDSRGILELRVLQHGRPVPACDVDVALE